MEYQCLNDLLESSHGYKCNRKVRFFADRLFLRDGRVSRLRAVWADVKAATRSVYASTRLRLISFIAVHSLLVEILCCFCAPGMSLHLGPTFVNDLGRVCAEASGQRYAVWRRGTTNARSMIERRFDSIKTYSSQARRYIGQLSRLSTTAHYLSFKLVQRRSIWQTGLNTRSLTPILFPT